MLQDIYAQGYHTAMQKYAAPSEGPALDYSSWSSTPRYEAYKQQRPHVPPQPVKPLAPKAQEVMNLFNDAKMNSIKKLLGR